VKDIESIVCTIHSLNTKIKEYKSGDTKIDTNREDWLEQAKKQSAELMLHFREQLDDLNDELTSDWELYSKQDIQELQEALGSARHVLARIGIGLSRLDETNLEDALFLLLLKGRHEDYRDCILVMVDVIKFAEQNNLNYKEQGKRMSGLFGDYVFHSFFDHKML